MTYHLWDTDIGRYFGRFDTEDEALGFVRTLLAQYGEAYAADLTLNWEPNAMTYRVFDTNINKLFGAFETEEEALTLVRALIGDNGDDYADDLAVAYERADGSFGEPLSGAALLARAEEGSAVRERAIPAGRHPGPRS